MDRVRQWLRDYRFSPLHLHFLFLPHFFFFSPSSPFLTEKQNTFVFSGSAVKILSWALAQRPLERSQGKSHETSVAKCSLIHMITIRLRTQPHLSLTYCYEANTFSFRCVFPTLRIEMFSMHSGPAEGMCYDEVSSTIWAVACFLWQRLLCLH